MKRLILLVLATLLLPVALAAPSVDYEVTPSDSVQVGEFYTIKITATDPDGLDSISLEAPEGNYYHKTCFGQATCTHEWEFRRQKAGDYVHTFYVSPMSSNNGVTKDVTVTVGGTTTAATEETEKPSDYTYSMDGAGDDEVPELRITLDGNPTIGNDFTITTVAYDDKGLDSIKWMNPGTGGYAHKTCFGEKRCVIEWTMNEDTKGKYRYQFLVEDTTGHGRIVDYDVNVAETGGQGGPTDNQTTPGTQPPEEQTATVSVTVTDQEGPVQGASVTLEGPGSYATTTNFNGIATLEVAPGCYEVTVTNEGQEFEKANICVETGETQDVTVGAKVAGITPLLGAQWMYILAAVIIIAVVGGSVYYYMNSEQSVEK